MGRARLTIAFLAAVALAACADVGEPGDGSNGAWVGTITTGGNVTTVVNESGSVWGGTAALVEEASIGVESGAEEYMFGTITGVYATDEHVYVVDRQVPRVRRYTLDGEFTIAPSGAIVAGASDRYRFESRTPTARSSSSSVPGTRYRSRPTRRSGIDAGTSPGCAATPRPRRGQGTVPRCPPSSRRSSSSCRR